MTNTTRLPADLAGALALIESLTVQRDAAEALAKERTIERDNYGQELDKATGMVEMLVDDAEAARLLWRSSEKACAHMDARRASAIADRDAAQQMVAECKAAIQDMFDKAPSVTPSDAEWKAAAVASLAARKLLTLSAPIAGRWCLASERDEAIEKNTSMMATIERLSAACGAAEASAESEHEKLVLRRKLFDFLNKKAEAREKAIGDELEKATDRIEGLVKENERFRHAAAETADLLMRGALEDDLSSAQQMVAELRATLTTGRDIVIETSTGSRHTKWVEQAYDAIEASAHIAGRWCLASERDAAQRVVAEFRGALADIADSEDEHGVPSTREWMERRASDALVSHGNNQFCLRVDLDVAIARAEVSDAAARTLGADFTRVLRECADAYDVARAAERRESETRRERDAVTAWAEQHIAALQRTVEENSRLRHAAAEVLSWSLNDMTALLSNPPQNAALFHAQRLLREARGE